MNMKMSMKKTTTAAAIGLAICTLAPSVQAAGLLGQCNYYCHVKSGTWGYIPENINGKLYAYKIVRDADGNPTGLGAQVGTGTNLSYDNLGSTGYNCILAVTTTTDSSSDRYAVNGEQLALVVKNSSGTKEYWRSYTVLPPCTWSGIGNFEASGIVDANFYDNNGNGLCDDWENAYDGYFDVTLGGADDDYDNDGLTNGQEFMFGTDASGGAASDYYHNTISLKDWSILDETTRKATVKIDGTFSHAYTIRYTTDLNRTGNVINFSKTSSGAEDTKYIFDAEADPFTQQVWFTLPDPNEVGTYYVGIAVDGVLAAYTMIGTPATTYTMTWHNDDGTQIDTTEVTEGDTPTHEDPVKAAAAPYTYTFTGWTPAIEAAASNTTYTATFKKVVDMDTAVEDYTAQDGDEIVGTSATYKVTIPSGATVTLNGVTVAGAAGGASVPDPEFAEGGESVTTKFAKKAGEGNVWTITAFAEMSNESRGTDVTASQVKVYRADTLEELKIAEAMADGVTITEKASAVKVTLEAEAPTDAEQQFFRVDFGE